MGAGDGVDTVDLHKTKSMNQTGYITIGWLFAKRVMVKEYPPGTVIGDKRNSCHRVVKSSCAFIVWLRSLASSNALTASSIGRL